MRFRVVTMLLAAAIVPIHASAHDHPVGRPDEYDTTASGMSS